MVKKETKNIKSNRIIIPDMLRFDLTTLQLCRNAESLINDFDFISQEQSNKLFKSFS